MSKVSKLIIAALSVGLVFGATPTTSAQAASKVKVVSTKKVKKVAYHAIKGKLYSTSKLKKVKYQIKKYPHTTWYSFKKATVKKNGKKDSYTYVKAGKKSGWLYSKYLIKGKAPKVKKVPRSTPTPKPTPAPKPQPAAPVSKDQQFKDMVITFQRILQNASMQTRESIDFSADTDYFDLALDLDRFTWQDSSQEDDNGMPYAAEIQRVNQDRAIFKQIYLILRGNVRSRISASQNSDLDKMYSQIENTPFTYANYDNLGSQYEHFSNAFQEILERLD